MTRCVDRLWLQRTFDAVTGRYGCKVLLASPVAYLAAELRTYMAAHPVSDFYTLDGDVLTITTADNRTVIYRIGEYDEEIRAYRMEWPD